MKNLKKIASVLFVSLFFLACEPEDLNTIVSENNPEFNFNAEACEESKKIDDKKD